MTTKFAPARCFFLATLCVLAWSAAGLAQTSLGIGSVPADDERLEQALTRRGSLHVVEAPLHEVVSSLSEQFHAPIVLSPKKLEEAGINVDVPVTRQIESAPLESILRLVLDELDLDFTIRHSVILVSTPENLESPDMMEMRIYPVRDLVLWRVPGAQDGEPSFEADYDSLIEVITTSVAPESWTDVGGPGSIKEFDNSEALVISQTRRVHREIEQLLTTLRKARELQGIASLAPPPAASSPVARRSTANLAGRASAMPPQAWQLPRVYSEE
jgi:hypothetical protein